VAGNELTLKDIQSILEIIKSAEDIQEFSLKFGGAEVQISRGGGATINESKPVEAKVASRPEIAAASAGNPSSQPGPVAKVYGPNASLIKSTMVGVFYRAPAPGEPPFVELGQRVEKDQVLCILEVMKLMNSVPTPVNGTVSEILVENGDPVEFGQVIMVIEGET
jgi:acetyl-CoA carboxylase biotin carboxyl carrier protein